MQGFCSEGIMLFPKSEQFDKHYSDYRKAVTKSAENLMKYFLHNGISTACFNTDEVAVRVLSDKCEWLAACPPEDERFVKMNCTGLDSMPEGRQFDLLYKIVREKIPVKRGLEPIDRFRIAQKREKEVAKQCLAKASLIATFCSRTSSYFKVKGAPGDGRLILWVNPINFLLEAEMSGAPMSASLILTDADTTKPVYDWEV